MTTKRPVTSVKVRMYRHGFGDCFLLSFFHNDDRVCSMLIDCGIKLNTKSETVPIERVIDDLKTTLTPSGESRPVLDVLVATHEHWDHVAFFNPEVFDDFFADFEIGQVWLAWTEDPGDQEAVAINSRLRDGVAALQLAAARLKVAEHQDAKQLSEMYFGREVVAAREQFNQGMDDVLSFYGVTALDVSQSGIKYRKNGKISANTEVAMNHIVKLGRKGGIRYFSPGTTVDRRLVPDGINVFVLGPPRSRLINKSDPSAGAARETYLSIDQTGLSGFIDGMLEMGAGAKTAETTASRPFGSAVGIPAEKAKDDAWFSNSYFAPSEAYRQIENSWLDVAGQFALQLDGAINNTSLVLAIELAESGKVLLFPGDAQVGSWLSWHDHKWKVKRGSKTETLTAEELLRNTVLYKVSHHGSHNATIRERGLEMMTHPDLVAMIPEKEKSYNGILFEPLLDRLNELCKGRVLISADSEHPPEDLLKNGRPDGVTATEWKAFRQNVIVREHYVEYTVQ